MKFEGFCLFGFGKWDSRIRGESKEQRAAKREGYAKDRTTIVGLVFPTGPPAIATILV